MSTPPQIVWRVHGSPAVDGCEPAEGRCFVCCGALGWGMPLRKWMGSNYTDQNRARCPVATHVCTACVFVHSRTSPVLGRPAKDGKKFGGNFRNYSHLWEYGWSSPAFGDGGETADGYVNASKGQKPLIRAFLEREHTGPWFAAIADSGQKHVLPFAPLNGTGRGGLVQFDDRTITVPRDLSLLHRMTELLTSGVTKDEISTGRYYLRTMRERREVVQEFERAHRSDRGGGWFTLALWLSQRDEEEHARREAKKTAGNAGGGDGAGVSRRVPVRAKRQAPARVLGSATVADPGRGKADDVRQRVGKPGATKVADTGPAQGRLPGFD